MTSYCKGLRHVCFLLLVACFFLPVCITEFRAKVAARYNKSANYATSRSIPNMSERKFNTLIHLAGIRVRLMHGPVVKLRMRFR